MKRFISILIIMIFGIPTNCYADWTDTPLVAHEMGGIDQIDDTNCLEAFEQSYQKGIRVFESDLILTSDNHLVARHDWLPYLSEVLEQDVEDGLEGIPFTYDEFSQQKILKKYHPLDFEQIVQLLIQYPDIYLITDTKETDPVQIQKQFHIIVDTVNQIDSSLLDRIIPEIYNPQMYDLVTSIHPFKNKIYSTYLLDDTYTHEDIVNFAVDHDFKIVAIDNDSIDPDYICELENNGILPYVFTVNSLDEMIKMKEMGVYGFYTDFLSPDTLNEVNSPSDYS